MQSPAMLRKSLAAQLAGPGARRVPCSSSGVGRVGRVSVLGPLTAPVPRRLYSESTETNSEPASTEPSSPSATTGTTVSETPDSSQVVVRKIPTTAPGRHVQVLRGLAQGKASSTAGSTSLPTRKDGHSNAKPTNYTPRKAGPPRKAKPSDTQDEESHEVGLLLKAVEALTAVVRQNVAKDKIKHTRDTNNTIQARTKTARARSIQDNPAKKSEKSAGDINRAAKSTNRPAKGSKNTVGAGNQKGKRLIGVEKAIGLEALLDEDHILEHRPNLWLRDACPCEKCVDPHSGQKSFATTELEFNPKVRSVARADDGSLTVVWAKDPVSGGQDHTSVYPASIQDGYTKYMHRELWTRATFEQEREKCRVSYDDWMAGGREFWDAMAALASKGLIFVHGVPQGDEQAVERLAGRIGALQDTFYGRTWDVVSKPAAENVAYTNKFLGLHQDLLYYPDPPRVQLLHCLANECEGGESLFSDGVRAAAHMKHTRPYAYELLRRHPAAYHYNRNGNAYYAERAVVKGSALRSRPAESVWWSPPFQAPYPIDGAGGMAPWFLAAQQFQSEIEDPANVVEHRLAAGECVVFDNWRVLHGRRQFNPGTGRRWLKGAYVDDRAFRARYEDMPALVAREHGLWKDRQVEAALNRDAIVRSSNEDYKLDPVAARADALIRLLSSKRVSVAKAKGLMADARTMVDNVRAEALGQAGHQSAESAPEVVQEGAKAQVGEQVQDSPGQHVEGQQGDKRPSS